MIVIVGDCMASRMERYYQLDTDTQKRSKRNQSLYEAIYETDNEYSNIEGIATIEKTNEVDINKIKEMLKQREENMRRRMAPVIESPKIEEVKIEKEETEEEKNYDIRDILVKAKSEKAEEKDDQYRSLKNTQYNILKGINLKEEIDRREYMKNEETDELKELIHTITNTDVLNKLGDQDLSLDLLSDLKSVNDTQIDRNSIRELLQEEKSEMDDDPFDQARDLDKSFYTSSLNFSDEDFDELGEIKKKFSKRRAIMITILVILFLAIVIVAGYGALQYL